MLRRPEPGTKVHIVWEDCFTVDAWTEAADLLTRPPWKVDSLGWFLGRTKTKSWVVSSGLTADTAGGIQGGSTWVIPQSLIRSWATIVDE